MAEFVKNLTRKIIVQTVMLSCMSTSSSMIWAENLRDPTRPSNSLLPAADAKAGDNAVTSTSGAPVLQSVLVSPGRTVAIISGQTVKLGEQFGNARVIKITESEVVLRNGNDLQTLRLFPNLEKRLSYGETGIKPNSRAQ
jgi:MSHA biogenesis protein MshK